jgi:hypothetical protein
VTLNTIVDLGINMSLDLEMFASFSVDIGSLRTL